HQENAEKIVKKYILLSGGAGLIPIPLFDQIVIGSLLVKMTFDLGQLYEVKITRFRSKAIITAILGGAHAEWIPRFIMRGLILFAPGINVVGMMVLRPAFAGAITYAVGNIFIKQFEAGHTLENFDQKQAKKDFGEQIKAGQRFVKEQVNL
ncbi:MAG: hypothetical protein HQM13_00005, partial [SAR324 cluster bacterium]|nr:hypothetical protein [SAR324 cluster bacterium]